MEHAAASLSALSNDLGASSSQNHANGGMIPSSSPDVHNRAPVWSPGHNFTTTVSPKEHVPQISRKVKACAACRKQKIKCNMPQTGPPCVRCIRRKLPCALNKSLQALIDESKQTERLHQDVANLHTTLSEVCKHLNLAGPQPIQTKAEAPIMDGNSDEQKSDVEADMGEPSPTLSPSDGPLAQAPMNSFINIGNDNPTRPLTAANDPRRRSKLLAQDILSRKVISSDTADRLATRFFTRLDHYVYSIASMYKSLDEVRKISPTLTACICAVSALHEQESPKLYETCVQEYRRLIARNLFGRKEIDFVRALCVGSYWLSDISRVLSSEAIRRAADLRLYKYYDLVVDPENAAAVSKAIGKDVNIEKARGNVRIWYLLYICDQHLSILYNRPPIIQQQESISNWEAYLDSPLATESDSRICSQVSLLLIMGQVCETFGTSTGEVVPRNLMSQMNNLNRQLDHWLSRWSTALKANEFIGSFPTKGVNIHYQFAKLHLAHHVFRGLGSGSTASQIPTHFVPTASAAVSSATSILEFLLVDEDLQEGLLGMPHYFHVMISFAAQFLLEVSTTYHVQLSINLDAVFSVIGRVVTLFGSTKCISYHPVSRIARGLAQKLTASLASAKDMGALTSPQQMQLNVAPNLPIGDQQQQYAFHSGGPNWFDGGTIFANAAFTEASDQLAGPVFDMQYGGFGDFSFSGMEDDFTI